MFMAQARRGPTTLTSRAAMSCSPGAVIPVRARPPRALTPPVRRRSPDPVRARRCGDRPFLCWPRSVDVGTLLGAIDALARRALATGPPVPARVDGARRRLRRYRYEPALRAPAMCAQRA